MARFAITCVDFLTSYLQGAGVTTVQRAEQSLTFLHDLANDCLFQSPSFWDRFILFLYSTSTSHSLVRGNPQIFQFGILAPLIATYAVIVSLSTECCGGWSFSCRLYYNSFFTGTDVLPWGLALPCQGPTMGHSTLRYWVPSRES